MSLDIILYRKKKTKLLHTFALFSFLSTCYLVSLINGHTNTTLSVSEEGANEYILRAEIWLDGFDSVFWQVSIEFLFVVFFVCSF